MCICEDTLAHILGALYVDDVMSFNLLTTSIVPSRVLIGVWDPFGASIKTRISKPGVYILG